MGISTQIGDAAPLHLRQGVPVLGGEQVRADDRLWAFIPPHCAEPLLVHVRASVIDGRLEVEFRRDGSPAWFLAHPKARFAWADELV